MIMKQKARDTLTGILGLILALSPLAWYLPTLLPFEVPEKYVVILFWIHLPLPLYYHYAIKDKGFYIAGISTYLVVNIANLVGTFFWHYKVYSNYQSESYEPYSSVFAMVIISLLVILIAGITLIAFVLTGLSIFFKVRNHKPSKLNTCSDTTYE